MKQYLIVSRWRNGKAFVRVRKVDHLIRACVISYAKIACCCRQQQTVAIQFVFYMQRAYITKLIKLISTLRSVVRRPWHRHTCTSITRTNAPPRSHNNNKNMTMCASFEAEGRQRPVLCLCCYIYYIFRSVDNNAAFIRCSERFSSELARVMGSDTVENQ